MKELPSSIIHFGSLSTVMDLCGEEETIEAVRIWNRIAKLYGHDIVYNFTAWPYSRKTLTMIQKELFTAVISIGSIAGTFLSYQRSGFTKSDCIEKVNLYASAQIARGIMLKISRNMTVKEGDKGRRRHHSVHGHRG